MVKIRPIVRFIGDWLEFLIVEGIFDNRSCAMHYADLERILSSNTIHIGDENMAGFIQCPYDYVDLFFVNWPPMTTLADKKFKNFDNFQQIENAFLSWISDDRKADRRLSFHEVVYLRHRILPILRMARL